MCLRGFSLPIADEPRTYKTGPRYPSAMKAEIYLWGDPMDLRSLIDTLPWEWPKNAGKLFLETLVDKQANESDRLIAAELAGDLTVMNDELAEVLLAIVGSGDEPEELRRKAAISLGPVLEQGYTELVEDDEFDDPGGVPISFDTFRNIQDSLRQLYLDESNPKELRRRILEAAVRAPQDWQTDPIRAAYSSGDKEWMRTAVFAMGRVRGFDNQILEALESSDPAIHCEAVNAAGVWELDAAWPHVVALVEDPSTPKDLLLAAIEAVGYIRPHEAGEILADLADSRDGEISEAATEAIAMAQAMSGGGDDKEIEDEGEWIN